MDPQKQIIPDIGAVLDIPKQLLKTTEKDFAVSTTTTVAQTPATASLNTVMPQNHTIPESPVADLLANKTESSTNQIAVVCCGGTGINWGYRLRAELEALNKSALGELTFFHIDTATSNFPNKILPENTFIMGGGEGSCKDRSLNAAAIMNGMPAVADRLKDFDFIIGIGGLSGGTGSVAMPVLNSEMVKRGVSCAFVGASSEASVIEIINTRKTLESFEKTAVSTGVPSVLAPYSNEKIGSEAKVDDLAINTVLMLSVLMSNLNHRLDNNDVRAFLNYAKPSKTKATNAPSRCVTLVVDDINGKIVTESKWRPISVATLAETPEKAKLPFSIGYQAVGFFPSFALSKETVHFMVVDGAVAELHKHLTASEDKFLNEERSQNWGVGIASNAPDSEFGDLSL